MSERKGIGGHQSATPGTTTWLTPPGIIRALGGAESFDLDPCAYPGWPTARVGFSLPVDGLAQDWRAHRRKWVNPPYTSGEIGAWLEKLAESGDGTALIFARSETEAFHAQVFERASGLLWLAGRLHFHGAHGDPDAPCMGGPAKAHPWATSGPLKGMCAACGVAKANAGAPSVLCAYGQDDLDRLAASDLPGCLTPLRFPRFVVVQALDDAPASWREVVMAELAKAGGAVSLSDLYRAISRHPKAADAPNWRPKVRQTLQRAGARRVGAGQWVAP